ncbi:hypothetical protein ACH4E8_23760 [Streptomyces sp. NPDC017979]
MHTARHRNTALHSPTAHSPTALSPTGLVISGLGFTLLSTPPP